MGFKLEVPIGVHSCNSMVLATKASCVLDLGVPLSALIFEETRCAIPLTNKWPKDIGIQFLCGKRANQQLQLVKTSRSSGHLKPT